MGLDTAWRPKPKAKSLMERDAMFIRKLSLPRRTVLRGMSAALALPLLDAMVPALTASAQTAAAPLTTAPPKIEAKEAAVAVAPQPGTSQIPARVMMSWQKSLITHLNRYKRYPDTARARGDEGVVRVEFKIDRSGMVLSSRVTVGSRSSQLDQEALAVLQRTLGNLEACTQAAARDRLGAAAAASDDDGVCPEWNEREPALAAAG